MGKFDDAVNGVGKMLSIGEMPNDPVVHALKRFSSWLKYILTIEVMLVLISALGFFTVDKIKKGETEALIDKTVEIASSLHFEQSEIQCPSCGSINLRETGGSVSETYYECLDCKYHFVIPPHDYKETEDDLK